MMGRIPSALEPEMAAIAEAQCCATSTSFGFALIAWTRCSSAPALSMPPENALVGSARARDANRSATAIAHVGSSRYLYNQWKRSLYRQRRWGIILVILFFFICHFCVFGNETSNLNSHVFRG
jgi:hypothetical protein